MFFWLVSVAIICLLSILAGIKILVSREVSKRRSFYAFKNEEGEDIPIGI